MKNKAAALLLTLVLLLPALAGCGAEKSADTIRIGMMSSSDVVPYVLINENGLAEKYGFTLELEVFTSAKDRDAALQAGELDGVLTDFIGVCMYQNAGFDVRITGITDGDYLLLAGKDAGISSVADIRGKSVAISENTLIDYSLDYILEANGMESGDVVREPVPRIPDRLELLRQGQVDLVLLPEPFATLALADGAVKLGSANGCGLYPAVSAFTKAALDEKGEAIKDLYKAYNEAVGYINSTPLSEYEALVIEAVGYPAEMAGKIELPVFRESALPSEGEVAAAAAWAAGRGLYPFLSAGLQYDAMIYDVYDGE